MIGSELWWRGSGKHENQNLLMFPAVLVASCEHKLTVKIKFVCSFTNYNFQDNGISCLTRFIFRCVYVVHFGSNNFSKLVPKSLKLQLISFINLNSFQNVSSISKEI